MGHTVNPTLTKASSISWSILVQPQTSWPWWCMAWLEASYTIAGRPTGDPWAAAKLDCQWSGLAKIVHSMHLGMESIIKVWKPLFNASVAFVSEVYCLNDVDLSLVHLKQCQLHHEIQMHLSKIYDCQ